MTMNVLARISRISFLTDMTRAGAPVIPLGFMFEGVWPAQARWLGLIGRLKLTPLELELVNTLTWPELSRPFEMLKAIFEHGWAAEWGHAGDAAERKWTRSALSIDVSDRSEILSDKAIDTEVAWATTSNFLMAGLLAFQPQLLPVLTADVVQFPRRIIPSIGQEVKFGTPETDERPHAA